MKQEIKIKFFNADLKFGLISWKEVYLIYPSLIPLQIETYGGRIIYRQKGSAKRISYNRLKKGLTKSDRVFVIEVPSWLF